MDDEHLAIDERDVGREISVSTFRVFRFRSADGQAPPWRSSAFDLRGVDVLAAMEWARSRAAADEIIAIAAIFGDEAPHRSLAWIFGIDPNTNDADPAALSRMFEERAGRFS